MGRRAVRLYEGIGFALSAALFGLIVAALPAVSDTAPEALGHFYGTVVLAHAFAWLKPRRAPAGRLVWPAVGLVLLALWSQTPWGPVAFRPAHWQGLAQEIVAPSLADVGAWLGVDVPRWAAERGLPSREARTLAFDVAVGLAVFGLVLPAVRRRRPLRVIGPAIGTLAAMDTFWPYDGREAIVPAAFLALLLLGWGAFGRAAAAGGGWERPRTLGGLGLAWAFGLSAFAAGAVAAGTLAPETAPAWPDPVPFLSSLKKSPGGAAATLDGYRGGLSALGGPFRPSDRPIFAVRSADGAPVPRVRWRLVSLERYTGQLWLPAEGKGEAKRSILPGPAPSAGADGEARLWRYDLAPAMAVHREPGRPVGPAGAAVGPESGAGEGLRRVEVRLETPATAAVYPEGAVALALPREAAAGVPAPATFDLESGALTLPPTDRYVVEFVPYRRPPTEVLLQAYRIRAQALGFAPSEWPAVAAAELGEEMVRVTTALPTTLPDRVRSLAARLARGAGTPVEIAERVERYLREEGGYRYAFDAPALEPGDDFVDQFLFALKTGYCDHFSTSMVVLLRAAGVPARWVKGFGPGEVSADGRTIVVRARDAHAWVEAYLPGSGWVPFDPTPPEGGGVPEGVEADAAFAPAAPSGEEPLLPHDRGRAPSPDGSPAQEETPTPSAESGDSAPAPSGEDLARSAPAAALAGAAAGVFLLALALRAGLGLRHPLPVRLRRRAERALRRLSRRWIAPGTPEAARIGAGDFRPLLGRVPSEAAAAALARAIAAYERLAFGDPAPEEARAAWAAFRTAWKAVRRATRRQAKSVPFLETLRGVK
ncbi:MAG: transglutaminase-like domain-containing protein [Hydrogenibacillus schlegelii]|uniref:Transglutaminase-like domain-containing protein n=1 Tax=Hydrogenibacillus schlegelii TaxID=1484 RepID=A0A947CWK3_HYDSH|nr:transglutaminase-like domain-containing protein [Hydrogenibacillus schlegelii]